MHTCERVGLVPTATLTKFPLCLSHLPPQQGWRFTLEHPRTGDRLPAAGLSLPNVKVFPVNFPTNCRRSPEFATGMDGSVSRKNARMGTFRGVAVLQATPIALLCLVISCG